MVTNADSQPLWLVDVAYILTSGIAAMTALAQPFRSISELAIHGAQAVFAVGLLSVVYWFLLWSPWGYFSTEGTQ